MQPMRVIYACSKILRIRDVSQDYALLTGKNLEYQHASISGRLHVSTQRMQLCPYFSISATSFCGDLQGMLVHLYVCKSRVGSLATLKRPTFKNQHWGCEAGPCTSDREQSGGPTCKRFWKVVRRYPSIGRLAVSLLLV
jgi:hypothetical protein